jgi:hypothetical protein
MRKQKEKGVAVPEITIDQAIELAGGVVEELRDLLRDHYADLTRADIRLVGKGATVTLPKAADDPQYAARMHRLGVACDHFLNSVRGVY